MSLPQPSDPGSSPDPAAQDRVQHIADELQNPNGSTGKRARSRPSNSTNPESGDSDERERKRQRRLLQNRQSAALSRQRKKEFLGGLERRNTELDTESKLLKQQLSLNDQRFHELEQKYAILLKQNEDLKFLLKNSDKSEELNRVLAQSYTAFIQSGLAVGVDQRNMVLLDQKLPIDHSFVPQAQQMQMPVDAATLKTNTSSPTMNGGLVANTAALPLRSPHNMFRQAPQPQQSQIQPAAQLPQQPQQPQQQHSPQSLNQRLHDQQPQQAQQIAAEHLARQQQQALFEEQAQLAQQQHEHALQRQQEQLQHELMQAHQQQQQQHHQHQLEQQQQQHQQQQQQHQQHQLGAAFGDQGPQLPVLVPVSSSGDNSGAPSSVGK